jgi:hypothetical protein
MNHAIKMEGEAIKIHVFLNSALDREVVSSVWSLHPYRQGLLSHWITSVGGDPKVWLFNNE